MSAMKVIAMSRSLVVSHESHEASVLFGGFTDSGSLPVAFQKLPGMKG